LTYFLDLKNTYQDMTKSVETNVSSVREKHSEDLIVELSNVKTLS